MIDVYLDNTRLDFEDTEKDSTVGSLIKAVEDELKGLRRFIAGVSVDGEEREDFRAEGLAGEPISGFRELRLTTGSMDDLALLGANTVLEYIVLVKGNIVLAAKGLRAGGLGTTDIITGLIGDLNEIIRTIQAIESGAGGLTVSIFNGDPGAFYGPVLEKMEAFKASFMELDTVAMADILEYEMLPIVEEMEGNIFSLEA